MNYVSGPYSVLFSAGQIRVSFSIAILDDVILEGNENFGLIINPPRMLSNNVIVGNPGQATVTIVDNDGKPCYTVVFVIDRITW